MNTTYPTGISARRAGFAVAGGAALIAHGLIKRKTKDVDLFLVDTQTSTVASAAAAFEAAVHRQGWVGP
ncbi:MAG: nucleotidyl transferase AbiEii/AbiGii toxin family protein [Streptosporangiaceae bacterium]